MKRISFMLSIFMILSGCGGGGQGDSSPTVTPPPVVQRSFKLLPMHYELLLDTGYLKDEHGGLQTADILSVKKRNLTVSTTTGFLPGQLVVLETDRDEHVSAKVQAVSTGVVSIGMTPATVGTPIRLHNFYNDAIHPNLKGYRAIADFAVQRAGGALLDHGSHVIIGDSWVAFEGLTQRMAALLPNATIINKGVAGNRISHVHARFDKDVTSLQPDYVWVLVGTNDYRDRHTAEYFVENLKILIDRIKAINAIPIIFDPSVGPPFVFDYDNYEMTKLSDEYAAAVAMIP